MTRLIRHFATAATDGVAEATGNALAVPPQLKGFLWPRFHYAAEATTQFNVQMPVLRASRGAFDHSDARPLYKRVVRPSPAT